MIFNSILSHWIGCKAAGPIIESITIGAFIKEFANQRWLRAADVNTADTVLNKNCILFQKVEKVLYISHSEQIF